MAADIEYGTLRMEEIPRVVQVINAAFTTNMAAIRRDEAEWRWRYLHHPGFQMGGCPVARMDGHAIGCVMVSEMEMVLDRPRKVGLIDDVSTLPAARGRGVARRMMNQAIDYMRSRGCEATALYADPHGVARDLYLDLGYRDLHRFPFFFKPWDMGVVLRDILPFAGALPWFLPWSLLHMPAPRGTGRVDPEEFQEAWGHHTRGLAGLPVPSPAYLRWKGRGNATHPIWVGVRHGGHLAAGARLCPIRVNLLGRHIVRSAWLNDIYGEPGLDPVAAALAHAPRVAHIMCVVSGRDTHRQWLLRRNGFLSVMGATFMVKPLVEGLDLEPLRDRVWHPLQESALGYP
ncbi:MAG: GNAT family N-acetyltransferase [Euryarchaeota archaeon]|nr:GNAT family N-acetyltransferase [Euryarchaeota archaeon]